MVQCISVRKREVITYRKILKDFVERGECYYTSLDQILNQSTFESVKFINHFIGILGIIFNPLSAGIFTVFELSMYSIVTNGT